MSEAYKPRVIVEYERQAYYLPYGNIRITFDKNLRTFNNHTNLFELNNAAMSPIFLNNNQVLEVKSGEELRAELLRKVAWLILASPITYKKTTRRWFFYFLT